MRAGGLDRWGGLGKTLVGPQGPTGRRDAMGRNVETLEAILPPTLVGNRELRPKDARFLAEWLAAHGVLAVDSLTDEDWYRIVPPDEHNSDEGIAALRRCATGQAP